MRLPTSARLGALVSTAVISWAFAGGCSGRAVRGPWEAVVVPTDATFSGIWFSDSLNGWLTGGGWAVEGGIVGRTRDGGRTWAFESGILGRGNGAALGATQFRDSLRGCATAGDGDVMVTGDGGVTWRPASETGWSGGHIGDLQFLDAWNGWAAGNRITRTEDGGETWKTLVRGTSENGYLSANGIHFVDHHRGWIVGQGGSMKRTEDGGYTWSAVRLPLEPGEHPSLWDITFADARFGWACGEHGSIFHSRDGGYTWARQQNGVPVVRVIPKGEPPRPRELVPELETEPDRLTLTAIQFADPMHGWAVGYYSDVAESVVLRTEDGGETWATEHVQPGEMLGCLFVLDAEHAWAAGDRARTKPQVVLRYSPPDR